MTEPEPSKGSSGLAAAVAKIRGRAFSSVERWMLIAGAVLICLGIPLILIGWYGASHTPYVFEQIPYVISGGLLGLAFTFAGGFLYFAYWLTRQVQETRRLSDRNDQTLRRLETVLIALAPGGEGGNGATASTNGKFVATKKGTMFHLPDCVVVSGREDLRSVDARAPGFEPCRICDPLATV